MLKISALAAIIFISSSSEFALATRTHREEKSTAQIGYDTKPLAVRYVFGTKFRFFTELQKDCKGRCVGKHTRFSGEGKRSLNLALEIKKCLEDVAYQSDRSE